MTIVHQVHAASGQTVLPVPVGFLPAGQGLAIDIAGTPVRYSFNSATSITIAAPPIGNQLVNLRAVPLGHIARDAALDFPSIAAGATQDLTVTVPGVSVGDAVALALPAAPAAGVVFSAFVSAASTVTVRALNVTGAAVDPASGAYRLLVSKG